jgi:hypothetical protein
VKINITNNTQSFAKNNANMDYKPLVNLFELLLEWDIKDAKEKEGKSEEVSQEIQHQSNQN